MSENRLDYLDIARGTGIILVILGHISYLGSVPRIFIVSFHMPLFFVISGMLIFIKKEEDKPLKDVAVRKLKSIMLPYYLYSALGIVIYIGYYLLTGRDGGWSAVLAHIVETLTLYGFSVMWFLPAICFSELYFLLILKKIPVSDNRFKLPILKNIRFRKSTVLRIAAVILPIFLFLFLNYRLEDANAAYGLNPAFAVFHLVAVALLRIPFCASFIAAGFLVARLLPDIFVLKGTKSESLALPAEIFIGLDLMGVTAVFGYINGVTDLHFLIFNNIFCYYAAALSGSFGVLLLSKALERLASLPPLRLLSYLGRNSLIIMVTHLNFYVLLLAEIGGMHFTKALDEGGRKHLIFMFLTLFFTLCGEIVLIEAISKGRERFFASLRMTKERSE